MAVSVVKSEQNSTDSKAQESVNEQNASKVGFDRTLLIVTIVLLCLGLVVISSASTMESMVKYDDSLYQTKKHLVSLAIAIACGFVTAMISTSGWKKSSNALILIAFILLVLTVVIGREINGAKRWLSLGFMNLQPSELVKLCWILYFANYVSKRIESVSKTIKGFIKPFLILACFAVVLLLQPDLGSCVVIIAITVSFLWVAGAGFIKYIICAIILGIAVVLMIIFEPYRLKRVTSFLDPWTDQFGSSFQLTQSLMAYGRGSWFGQGLGNSYQKLGYLPEAHTDFISSIFGEEFGVVGMLVLLLLQGVIVYKAILLGTKILREDAIFQGYVAFGIGFWFFLQTIINIGVASAAMPTKGLTLPLVSYGGSSLLVSCVAIAILLRIDYEWKNEIISKYRKNEV